MEQQTLLHKPCLISFGKIDALSIRFHACLSSVSFGVRFARYASVLARNLDRFNHNSLQIASGLNYS